MGQARHTSAADEDLARISRYIAADNPAAALRWLDDMQAVCELLAAQPATGQRVTTKRLGTVRRHVSGNYLIYYRPIGGGVEILNVVHGARDQDRIV